LNRGHSADVLDVLLSLLRVRPELRQVCRFGPQWTSDHAAESDRWAPFHLVTQGTCVIELDGPGRTVALSAGDAVVLPHGTPHVVRGATMPAGVRGPFGIHTGPAGAISLASNTGGEPETQLICGRLRFDLAHDNLVLAHRQAAWAVAAMLDDPARSWTLNELAARAHASRASLVHMFQRTARLAPLAFLAELRLELARRKLSSSVLPVAAIAEAVGYKSESAFSRAFHRHFGVRPGQARGGGP
jgi:AraC-like DNA-binding protein